MRDKMPAIAHYFAHFRSLQSRRDWYGTYRLDATKGRSPAYSRKKRGKKVVFSYPLLSTGPLRLGDLCASATSAPRRPLRLGDLCASATSAPGWPLRLGDLC